MTWQFDPTHTRIEFAAKHMLVAKVRGTFDSYDLVADIDEQDLAKSSAILSIDVASVDTGVADRDAHLRSADFFDADNHPEIRFSSEQVEIHADQSVRVTGELTMRGVTRTVSAYGRCEAPVEDPFGTRRAALELQTTLDRRDWGLDWQRPLPSGDDALGWTVDVTIHLELIEQS